MSDLISRQAAIDVLDAYQVMVENGEENPYAWARLRMCELPSEQQEIIRCKDCEHYLDGGCGNVDSQSPSKKLMGVKPDWFCADGERKDDA